MSILNQLSHSHHELDLLFLDLKRDVEDMASAQDPSGREQARRLLHTVEWLSSVLKAHSRFEEEKVFPELRKLLGADCARVDELERQHRALQADVAFLEEGARGVVHEGRLLDMEAVIKRVHRMVEAFDEHGELEADVLDTTANLLNPAGEGAG